MDEQEILSRLQAQYAVIKKRRSALRLSFAGALFLPVLTINHPGLAMTILLSFFALIAWLGWDWDRRWRCPVCGKRLPDGWGFDREFFEKDAHPYRCPGCGTDIPLAKIAHPEGEE